MTGSPDLPDPRDDDVEDLTNNYEGLLELHEIVPAAEEIDLAEELAAQREAERYEAFDLDRVTDVVDYRSVTADADLEATQPVVEPAAEDEPDTAEDAAGPAPDEVPLSDGQVQGLVEHLLHATPIPDEDEQPGS